MSNAIKEVFEMVKEHEVDFVDVRFTDTRGKWQHVTFPISQLTEDVFEDGFAFDGSSVAIQGGVAHGHFQQNRAHAADYRQQE